MKKLISIVLIILLNLTQIIWVWASVNNNSLKTEPIPKTELVYPKDGGVVEYNNVQDFYVYFNSVESEIVNFSWKVKVWNIDCEINDAWSNFQFSDITKYYIIRCSWNKFKDWTYGINVAGINIWKIGLKFAPYEISNSFWADFYNGIKWSRGAVNIEWSIFNWTSVWYKTIVDSNYKVNNSKTTLEVSEYNWWWLSLETELVSEKAKDFFSKFGLELGISWKWYVKFLNEDLIKNDYKSLNTILNDNNALNNFIEYLILQKQIVSKRIYSLNWIYELWHKPEPICEVDWYIWDDILKIITNVTNFDNILHPSSPSRWDLSCSSEDKTVFNERLRLKKIVSTYQAKLIWVNKFYELYKIRSKYNWYNKEYSDCIKEIIGDKITWKYVLKGWDQTIKYKSYQECVNTINHDNKVVYDLFRWSDYWVNSDNAKLLYRNLLKFLSDNSYEMKWALKLDPVNPERDKITTKSNKDTYEIWWEIKWSIKVEKIKALSAALDINIEWMSKQSYVDTYDNKNNNIYIEKKPGQNIEYESEFKIEWAFNVWFKLSEVAIKKFLTADLCHFIRVWYFKKSDILTKDWKQYRYDFIKKKTFNINWWRPLDNNNLVCEWISGDIINNIDWWGDLISYLSWNNLEDIYKKIWFSDNDIKYIKLWIKILLSSANFSAGHKFSSLMEYNKDDDEIKISFVSYWWFNHVWGSDAWDKYVVNEYVFKFDKGFVKKNEPSFYINTTAFWNSLTDKIKHWTLQWIKSYTLNNYYVISSENSEDNEYWIRLLSYVGWNKISKIHKFLQYSIDYDLNNRVDEYKISDLNSAIDIESKAKNILANESDKDRVFNIYALTYISFLWYNAVSWKLTPNFQDRDWKENIWINSEKFKKSDNSDTYFYVN